MFDTGLRPAKSSSTIAPYPPDSGTLGLIAAVIPVQAPVPAEPEASFQPSKAEVVQVQWNRVKR
jgi:hypothetical protein